MAQEPPAEEAAERADTLASVKSASEGVRVAPPAEGYEAAPWARNVTSGAQAPQTAIEERDLNVLELERSGPDRLNLLAQANVVGAAWKALAEKSKADVSFGPWTCHAGGCFVTALHAGAASVDKLSEEITQTDEFLEWNSTKMRSGPIQRTDGTVEITWILHAPASDEAAPASATSAAPAHP